MSRVKKPLVWAEVDLACLRHNLRAVRRAVGNPRVGILAVVKADAYGHGMKAVARELWKDGVSFFGVANIDEALELKKICPQARILVLGSFHSDQILLYVRHRITPTISSWEDAAGFEKMLARGRRVFPVHVKIDTGMGRLGVWHEEAEGFFKKALSLKHVRIEGVYTHFSSADAKDRRFTDRQIRIFNSTVHRIRKLGLHPVYLHAANGVGLVRFKKAHLNLVRPGLILYGLNPAGPRRLAIRLKPVLSLKARISFLKKTSKGRSISYGATYRTTKPTWIATLPVGYSHGYRVGLSSRGFVIVRGRRCPVVGRVTMDQTLVDVGALPRVKRWEEVVLIGKAGRARVPAEELAKILGTIPYEIVCAIHNRIPRIYKNIRR